MPILKSRHLRGQIAGVLKKRPDTRIIAFKTADRWEGDPFLLVDDKKFLVARCISQLAIRESILNAKEARRRLVVVTNLDDPALADDLRPLLAKRKLIPIRPWPGVQELFRARGVEPSVIRKPWLADVLLGAIPDRGFNAAANGFLTAERVWREVLSATMDLSTPRPDVKDLLIWSLDERRAALYRRLPGDRREDVREWIRESAGAAGVLLLELAENAEHENLPALGLCLDAISGDPTVSKKDAATRRDAAIRLENDAGGRPLAEAEARPWREAARQLFSDLARKGEWEVVSSMQARLDALLVRIGAGELAWLSPASAMGFEQRLERFADELTRLLNKRKRPDFRELGHRLGEVEAHLAAGRAPGRLTRLRMAFRLIRWLWWERERGEPPRDFGEAAGRYARDGGFIDRARYVLYGGEGRPGLSKAFGALLKKVDKVREDQNRRFAELLAGWTAAGSGGEDVTPIEDILEKVVAPAARGSRVLLIVMDGMSHAVFADLKEDMVRNDSWAEATRENHDFSKPVVAALPTVTEVSRRGLLRGALSAKQGDDEARGFAKHPALRRASGAEPPVLFHKADLFAPNGVELSDRLTREILSARRGVVGVVVNVVDDFLDRNDQLNISWRVEDVPALAKLLFMARQTGRTVILTSDHGHVLDHGAKLRRYDAGERWRPDDGAPRAGEIAIRGDRVLRPANGKMIAPWSEHLRYRAKKNGYHGGLTPQEVIVPLAAMKPRPVEKGWTERPFYEPEW
ncbi:MAG: BREX-2 system phosphatase PglZ, partial [Desulfobacterales bacterium]|nr:BREX-2 system phosphatase PglZ [Desulfobacterales bacterium]